MDTSKTVGKLCLCIVENRVWGSAARANSICTAAPLEPAFFFAVRGRHTVAEYRKKHHADFCAYW